MINDDGEQYIIDEQDAILRKMHLAMQSERKNGTDSSTFYNRISECYVRLQALNNNLERKSIR